MAAGTACTTFLAVFLALCPCPEMAAAVLGEHGCCLPETALRSADSDCCPSLSTAPKLVTPPEVSVAPAPGPDGLSAVAVQTHDDLTTPRLSSPPVFSPPTVLRI